MAIVERAQREQATREAETPDIATDQKQATLLDRIGLRARQTLDLAEGFVQLSKAEQRAAYQFDTYDVNAIVTEAADALYEQAQLKRVQISAILPQGECLLRADAQLLWRALTNLLSNALRYAPEGSLIKIRVQSDHDLISITLSDQGAGISKAQQASLFQQFKQGSERRDGAGLGLAFVHAVVLGHSGSIIVQSPCEQWQGMPCGTAFTLILRAN